MQLLPRALVVGAFLPPNMPGMGGLDSAKINRIWSEVAPRHHFTQLQMSPDGSGANFIGPTMNDGVAIQLPLIQVRSSIQSTTDEAGREAQSILGIIAKHAAAPQLFNPGIRLVYAAALPNNDARGFVLHQLLNDGEDHLAQLGGVSDQSWGGVKYVVPQADRTYTVIIEPTVVEQMRSLYIDVDTAFPPGPFDLEGLAARVDEVRDFLAGPLSELLDATAA